MAWHVDRVTREGMNAASAILDVVEGKDPATGRQVRERVRLLDTKGLDSDPGPGGDDSAFRLKFLVEAEIARAERNRMKDRTRAAHRRALAAGRWAGGPAPYGFQIIANPAGPGKVLAHQPAEVAFIRDAARRVLTGETITAVTRWANTQSGMRPRKASTWGRKALAHVLTGFPVQGKVITSVDGKLVPVVDEAGTPLTVEPILDPDTAAAVRQALAVKDPNAAKGGRRPSRLLSGIVRCSGCDAKMTVSRRRNGHVNYRCPDGYAHGLCKRPVSISAPLLEEFVERTFLAQHGHGPAYTKTAQVTGAAAVEAAQEAATRALNAYAADPTPENSAAYQQAKADFEAAQAVPRETRVILVPTGRTVAEDWAASDLDGRREILAANLGGITIMPGQRGKRTIDTRRVWMPSSPPLVRGQQDETWRPGKVVVEDEDADE